jgi:hypothetical protein
MQSGSQPLPQVRHRHNSLTGGLILIFLGIVFLLQQMRWFSLQNWWAVFILIPALGNFGTAWTLFRRAGRFTQAVRASLFSGLIVLMVALMFLLDLSWSVYWPLFVLLPGLGLVFAGLPLQGDRSQTASLFAGPWLSFTGLGAVVLGLGFLGQNLGWFHLVESLPRWWAIPIFFPAMGGLIAAAWLWLARQARLAAISSLAAALIVAAVGLAGLLSANWNLIWPVALIAAGAVLLLGVLGGRNPEE